MLKHVQISPLRNRSDSVSMRSTTSCASSMCGSPEPPTDLQRTHSRASSYSSLSEQLPQTTIKVFTNCLKIDIEYKTLGIQWDTTSKEVIAQLLRRLKMRHRDPRLFYLSMEVSVRRAGVKTILVLDEDTRPAILQACHPKGESRFCLQLKPGGLIRVHTSALQPTSQYKSLVISEETTSDELLQLLLSCYSSMEPVEHFSIYEVCPGQEYQRKLHPDDIPLRAQAERMKRGETCHFLVRRNPNYARRRQLLTALNEVVQTYPSNKPTFDANSTISSLDDSNSLLDISIESLSDDLHSLMASDEDEDCAYSTSSASSSSDTSSSDGSITMRRATSNLSIVSLKQQTTPKTVAAAVAAAAAANNITPKLITTPTTPTTTSRHEICLKCRNNFKSCEFCYTKANAPMLHLQRQIPKIATKRNVGGVGIVQSHMPTYNPVYNIREIRTVSHSFSSLGSDKKLLDIELNARFDPTTCRMRPQSLYLAMGVPLSPTPTPTATAIAAQQQQKQQRMIMDANANAVVQTSALVSSVSSTTSDVNGNNKASDFAVEAVNNNPARGLGHFVYL